MVVITLSKHQMYSIADVQRAYNSGFSNGHSIGYGKGLQDGLAQGPTHPAVQQSVANVFGDWDGAQAAQQRSIDRFEQQRTGGDRS